MKRQWPFILFLFAAVILLSGATSAVVTVLSNRVVDFTGSQLKFSTQSSLTNEDGLWAVSPSQLATLAALPKGISVDSSSNLNIGAGQVSQLLSDGSVSLANNNFTVDASGNVVASTLLLGSSLYASIAFFKTNAAAAWPTNPSTRGGAALINSNGTIYLFTSAPSGNTWAATNKLAP